MKPAIIIPTFDNLSGLKKLLKSIDTEKFKVIVIEDGVNKKTITWLRNQKDYPISVAYHQENKGIAYSWNEGLRYAQMFDCTHFAILNDDLELPKDWWDVVKKEFENGAHLVTVDDPSPIPLTGWFFVIDQRCVDKVGMFDEQFSPFCGEDHDYWLRFRDSGLKRATVHLDIKHVGSGTVSKLDREYYVNVRKANWQRLRDKYPNERFTAQNF